VLRKSLWIIWILLRLYLQQLNVGESLYAFSEPGRSCFKTAVPARCLLQLYVTSRRRLRSASSCTRSCSASNTSFVAWRPSLCGCWTTCMEQSTWVHHWLLVTSHLQEIYQDLLGRPYGVTGGLIKCSWCFFFSTRNFRAPAADHRQILPHDRKLTQNYKLSLKVRGPSPPPKKNGGRKHAKFRPVLDHFKLWSRISPELLKTSKIGKLIDREQFLLRSRKKILWTLVH